LIGRLRFWRHTFTDWARTVWTERHGSAAPPPRHHKPASTNVFAALSGALQIRHAVRSLRRDPAFSLIAVITLAVGMSVTTVVFSLRALTSRQLKL